LGVWKTRQYAELLVKAALYSGNELFVTAAGIVGMAYKDVRIDDTIAMWEGCQCPVIIRRPPANDSKAVWQLHGPAYVDSIMNGEAWPVNTKELRESVVV